MFKQINSDPRMLYVSTSEVYGGVNLNITPGVEMTSLLNWWQMNRPLFEKIENMHELKELLEISKSDSPTVQDAFSQLKTVYALSKAAYDKPS